MCVCVSIYIYIYIYINKSNSNHAPPDFNPITRPAGEMVGFGCVLLLLACMWRRDLFFYRWERDFGWARICQGRGYFGWEGNRL